jgi:hypothetical protein
LGLAKQARSWARHAKGRSNSCRIPAGHPPAHQYLHLPHSDLQKNATAPAPVTARRSGMRSGSGSQVGDDLAEHGHSSGDVLEAGRERKGGMDLGLSELLEWQRTDHVSPVDEVFGLAIVLVAGHIVPSFLAAWRVRSWIGDHLIACGLS